MNIYLSALGCRLNEAELEAWSTQFRHAGHQIAKQPQDADLFVLNTCAVTQEAVRKSRKLIQRLHRENPQAKLVATGCYSALSDTSAHRELGIDLVVSNADKDSLVTQVEQQLGLPSMPEAASQPSSNALFQRNRQRAFIKIQDGCRYRCTYCIVTLARGEERSRPPEDIIHEVNRLYLAGVQEIVLTGVHVGGYGSDLNQPAETAKTETKSAGLNLFYLVKKLLEDTDIPRIRFASVEPWDLPSDFFSLFENQRLMPHMHLPLQSGSDSVLRRMSRRCRTADFTRLAETIRTSIPDFNITTDIIVGFPGETDKEWRQTLEYVESIGFGHIHVFSFSARQGTKAACLPGQIHGGIKKQRSQALHQLAARQKREALQSMLGKQVEVLWESARAQAGGRLQYAGYTANYHRICTLQDAQTQLENAISLTQVEKLDSNATQLLGQPTEILSHPAQTRENHRTHTALPPPAADNGSLPAGVISITPV